MAARPFSFSHMTCIFLINDGTNIFAGVPLNSLISLITLAIVGGVVYGSAAATHGAMCLCCFFKRLGTGSGASKIA